MKGPPWTLASRLALWFALASALVLGAIGAYLYRSLEQQLVEREDRELVAKIDQMRHQLREMPGGLAPGALLHNVYGHEDLFLEVQDGRGNLLAASKPGGRLGVPSTALAATQPVNDAQVQEWQGGGRITAAWAAAVPAEAGVLLIIAKAGARRLAVLASYRDALVKGVIAGALAMALLGYATARSALRPVRTIARRAGGITANRLGERLSVEDSPGELAQLVAAFNAMLERLDDSFRRLAQFSSDLAHDLRTPVANLVSGTQVALSRPRSAEEYEALLAAHLEEYDRINRMIDGMLFLARADNAQLALRLETLDTRDELARIAEYFAGPAEEAGVTIDVEALGTVHADGGLFRRAVGNVVANAVRYTPRGRRVLMRAFESGQHASVVEVCNPGPPIPSEQLPHLFERFYRGDSSRSQASSGPGSGLGLAIVQSVMALHGGDAAVESRPGQETVFRLTFPRPGMVKATGP